MLLTTCFIGGCTKSGPASNTTQKKQKGPIIVTSTTTMLTDLVKIVGGSQVRVQGLMGPGVDPHLYKASSKDLFKLKLADVIFYSGLTLEGKLQAVLETYKKTKKHVYAVTDAIPRTLLIKAGEGHDGTYDPHIWFDASLWARCVDSVIYGLSKVDPKHADDFKRRGADFKKELETLHSWVLESVQPIPAKKRILVTSHDAFGYFGRAYGFQVIGLQGLSTVDQAGLLDVTKLVDFIKEQKVKAIFVETSVNAKALKQISASAGVAIGGELFSDAMGLPGEIDDDGNDKGTYIGMMKYNVLSIVKGLK